MRVELIDHHPDAVGIRVVVIGKFDHPVDELDGSPPLGNFDVYPASQWFRSEMNPLFTVAFVSVVDPCDRSRSRRERVALVATECFAGFVEADDWTVLVVWFVVEVENVLHVVDEVGIVLGWDRPVVREMRFEGVF